MSKCIVAGPFGPGINALGRKIRLTLQISSQTESGPPRGGGHNALSALGDLPLLNGGVISERQALPFAILYLVKSFSQILLADALFNPTYV